MYNYIYIYIYICIHTYIHIYHAILHGCEYVYISLLIIVVRYRKYHVNVI